MLPDQYKTFKVLGILLCYPSREWLDELPELIDLIAEEELLTGAEMAEIRAFSQYLTTQDIYDLQEAYVDAFDRVKALSLHLFEHVHGESRDRGQAMVDLASVYQQRGLVVGPNELPDYLPAFLEFLTELPKAEALAMLADPAQILVALGKRLAECGSPYQAVFHSLIRLAGATPEEVAGTVSWQKPSLEQMDQEWAEDPIQFLGATAPQASGGCGAGVGAGCGGSTGCGSPASQGTQSVKPMIQTR